MVQLSQQKNKTRNTYIISGIAILMFVFGCHQMQEKQQLKAQQSNTIDFLQDSVRYYKNQYGQEVATKNALSGDKNQLEILLSKQIDSTESLKKLVKKYKKVNAAIKVRTVTEIKEVRVPFNRPVEFDFSRKFKIDNPFYSLSGISDQNGLNIKHLSMNVNVDLVMGKRKNGFLKPASYSVDAVTDNPHSTITGLDGFFLKEDYRPWSVGPSIGYDPFNNQFNFNLSIQYTVVRF